ncbi:hypothetical protein BC828DRAFT_393071 [Blastocladiella britannica]|nr:hypothetical protein BC828DRAFT_393071 [Blastocladiella britannica]
MSSGRSMRLAMFSCYSKGEISLPFTERIRTHYRRPRSEGNQDPSLVTTNSWAAGCHPHWYSMRLANNQIGDTGAAVVAAKLPLSLTELSVANNKIGDSGAAALGAMLPLSLTYLDLSTNLFGDPGATVIAAKLSPSLVEVHLGHNKIGDTGAAAIALAVLKVLDLKANKIQRPSAIQQQLASHGVQVDVTNQVKVGWFW